MDNKETLPVNDDLWLPDSGHCTAAEETVWGRLLPLSPSFSVTDLTLDNYRFGRNEDCEYVFDLAKHGSWWQSYSKIHFRVYRDNRSTGCHVFLQDLSSNGTFVNGQKVGKNCFQALSNMDEIALTTKKHKAFIFVDSSVQDDGIADAVKAKYTLAKELGRGACGVVRLAFAKGTYRQYAVKVIQKKQFSTNRSVAMNPEEIMREVEIMKKLDHPCIVKIEDVIDTPDVLYVVLELVEGGELFDRVEALSRLDEPSTKVLFYQMVCAVKYLHTHNISHRDLKLENVLLCNPDSITTLIKVSDFGLSKLIDGCSVLQTFCGTPNYIAPEILRSMGTGTYTAAVDCWSLGVILYACLSGTLPFSSDRKDMKLEQQILSGNYGFPEKHWYQVSVSAKDLIKQLLIVDPEKRISIDGCLQHPWLLQDKEAKECAHSLMYPKAEHEGPPIKRLKGRSSPTDLEHRVNDTTTAVTS